MVAILKSVFFRLSLATILFLILHLDAAQAVEKPPEDGFIVKAAKHQDRETRVRVALALSEAEQSTSPEAPEIRASNQHEALDWSLTEQTICHRSSRHLAPAPRAKAPCPCGDCCQCPPGKCSAQCPAPVPAPIPPTIPDVMPIRPTLPATPATQFVRGVDQFGREVLYQVSPSAGGCPNGRCPRK